MRKSLFTIFITIFSILQLSAQEKNKQTNYPICLRPDFYSRTPGLIKDTTYIFQCYDVRDSVLDADTLINFDNVKHISLFKCYSDYAHKYKERDGTEQPLPVQNIVGRYDKTGNTNWMVIDYTTNKMSELTELKEQIIRTDTVKISNKKTGETEYKIFQYYGHSTSKY